MEFYTFLYSLHLMYVYTIQMTLHKNTIYFLMCKFDKVFNLIVLNVCTTVIILYDFHLVGFKIS